LPLPPPIKKHLRFRKPEIGLQKTPPFPETGNRASKKTSVSGNGKSGFKKNLRFRKREIGLQKTPPFPETGNRASKNTSVSGNRKSGFKKHLRFRKLQKTPPSLFKNTSESFSRRGSWVSGNMRYFLLGLGGQRLFLETRVRVRFVYVIQGSGFMPQGYGLGIPSQIDDFSKESM